MRAEDIPWIEEATMARDRDPIRLEFAEKELVA